MSWLTQYNLFLILAKSGCICTAAGHTSWPSTWSKADLWMSSPNCLSKPSSIELAAHIPQITLTLLSEERLTTHSRQVCCSLHQAPPPQTHWSTYTSYYWAQKPHPTMQLPCRRLLTQQQDQYLPFCHDNQNWGHVDPLSTDHLPNVSTRWLKSTVGKFRPAIW